jgi:hypothetical protein
VADGSLALEAAIATEVRDDPVPMRMRGCRRTRRRGWHAGFVRAGRKAEGVDPFGQRYFRGVTSRSSTTTTRRSARRCDALDRAGWITVSSQRYDTVSRDPYRFPLTMRYYDALFGGNSASTSSPVPVAASLGPVAFDPQVHPWPDGYLATRGRAGASPEEALSVYDHPPVTVLRKRADYDARRVREILAGPVLRTFEDARREDAPATVGRVVRSPAAASAAPDLLMLSPQRIQALDATPPPPAATLGSRTATIAWYLVVALLGAAALPALVALMPSQPALAFGIARIAGVFGFGRSHGGRRGPASTRGDRIRSRRWRRSSSQPARSPAGVDATRLPSRGRGRDGARRRCSPCSTRRRSPCASRTRTCGHPGTAARSRWISRS